MNELAIRMCASVAVEPVLHNRNRTDLRSCFVALGQNQSAWREGGGNGEGCPTRRSRKYFKGNMMNSDSKLHDNDAKLTRLSKIDWDFSSSETTYLTHNLHPYPAKFIPQIPNALIHELSSAGETVADIFCGSGTTLLEALRLKRRAIGIDASPLATLISRAKTTPLFDADFEELANHHGDCKQLLANVGTPTENMLWEGKPFRSGGWRPSPDICQFWFVPHVVEELAEVLVMIGKVRSMAAQLLCKVVFSAIIVRVSKQDSDTRYVRREKDVKPGDTVRLYLAQLDSVIPAVREMSDAIKDSHSCQVLAADLLETPETEPFDLVVTSPPYPNAYSYHLYHRTRLIWLGYDPGKLKRVEIGSHRKYSSRGRNRATPETFRSEFEVIFRWIRDRLRDRCYACFVVGDSTIQGERIDNASLVADAGAKFGFREVARIERAIASTRKAFNPKIGRIKSENILILQKV